MSRYRLARSDAAVLAVAGALALLPGGSRATHRPTIQRPQFLLVVHGGAGTIRRADMTLAQDSAYRAKLTQAIRAGYDVLRADGTSLDAVIATITVLEESPLFNAGRGAVFTNAGTNELDAAIMAGTYASASCAVSGTGVGEYFMRNVVAYDICARVLYKGETLAAAADSVILRKLVAQGGEGGVIALDREGNFVMTFNSEGMYRGHVGPDGESVVRIYRDE